MEEKMPKNKESHEKKPDSTLSNIAKGVLFTGALALATEVDAQGHFHGGGQQQGYRPQTERYQRMAPPIQSNHQYYQPQQNQYRPQQNQGMNGQNGNSMNQYPQNMNNQNSEHMNPEYNYLNGGREISKERAFEEAQGMVIHPEQQLVKGKVNVIRVASPVANFNGSHVSGGAVTITFENGRWEIHDHTTR
jgi:hypothetical protein